MIWETIPATTMFEMGVQTVYAMVNQQQNIIINVLHFKHTLPKRTSSFWIFFGSWNIEKYIFLFILLLLFSSRLPFRFAYHKHHLFCFFPIFSLPFLWLLFRYLKSWKTFLFTSFIITLFLLFVIHHLFCILSHIFTSFFTIISVVQIWKIFLLLILSPFSFAYLILSYSFSYFHFLSFYYYFLFYFHYVFISFSFPFQLCILFFNIHLK